MFTLEQIEEIYRKLQLLGVKDMDLPTLTEQLDGSEVLTLIKNGRNIQLMVSQFLNFDMFTPEQLGSLRGPQGLEGKNAYQTWLAQGNVGTYDDYLTILQLPALTASETLTITVNDKLDEADNVIIKLNNKNEEMQQVISEATIAKDLAQEVVTHPPAIINGYWHLWNHITNQYDTTYVKAAGDTAYEIWLAEGNAGTVEDYLADIKGDPFTYDDFTPKQIEALKVKGDAFEYSDFTQEQIALLQKPASDIAKTVSNAEDLLS